MTIKCDLHVHSKYSNKPTNWITKKFGAPESFTEPLALYKMAKEKGMTHVTITDHNKIKGALELCELYEDAFVSCEVTVLFPEDNCKCHVLVYDIDEAQYKDLMYHRKNIYDFVGYTNEEGIWHALAHPFYAVSDHLSQWHFERFLIMFDIFELNGFRSLDVNNNLLYVINSLDEEILALLYAKHQVGGKIDPDKKHFIRGSDDHSGQFVAKNYTKNMGKKLEDFFINARHNYMEGRNGTPKDLAYAVYNIGYQHMDRKFGLEKYVTKDISFSVIDQFMKMKISNGGPVSSVYKQLRRFKTREKGDVKSMIIKAVACHKDFAGRLHEDNVSERWFDLVSTAVNESTKDLLDYLFSQINSGNFFNVFRSFGSLSALYFLLAPYYVGYFIFQNTKRFSQSINIGDGKIVTAKDKMKVGHFTDTFNEVNGVAVTLQQAAQCAKKFGLDYTFITCSDQPSFLGEMVFDPVQVYDMPEYPELKMATPPILDIVDYCYKKDFTHIHSATPGTMGLVAMLVAKLLQKPFYSTYHTALPQYVEALTGEAFMTGVTWQYMIWYYGQCDLVFARSESFKEELIENGLPPEKIVIMPKGVDTDRFHPADKKPRDRKRIIYIGRVSIEKDLDILIEAFKLIDRDVELVVVGDGPYREEMESKLIGYNATFTGYLYDNELVEQYQQADLYVFPSTKDTMGNVILEANACGIPAIVTNKGGPQENVIDEETGWVIEGRNISALYNKILYALYDADLETIGKNARKHVEKMTFDKAFLEWVDNYK